MLTDKEIIEFWKDNLYKYEIDCLNQFNLDEDTKKFLSTVGILKEYVRKFRFIRNIKLEEKSNKIRIMEDIHTKYGIYIEVNTGNIVYVDHCNTSVRKFIEFCTIKQKKYSEYMNSGRDVENDDYESYRCAREMIELFKIIDSKFLRPDFGWIGTLWPYFEGHFYDNHKLFKDAVSNGKYDDIEDAYYDAIMNGIEVIES